MSTGPAGAPRAPEAPRVPAVFDANGPRAERPARALPLRHALALGLLHGPAELLPISSSAHVTLIPWLAGWPYRRLDPASRKTFEVALHAGTAFGLMRNWRAGVSPAVLAAAAAVPAAAGYPLHGPIERRLGSPRTIAAGLVGGSLALAWAETRVRRRGAAHRLARDTARRSTRDATLADGLALGAAQALALIPGVSRSGATFAAARARGFTAMDAERMSLAVGLPVLGGATLLQGVKQLRRGLDPSLRQAVAVGACSAAVSTLLASTLLDSRTRAKAALPAALYRLLLAGVVLKKGLTSTAGDGGILGASQART